MDFFERLDSIGSRLSPEIRGEMPETFLCGQCSDSGLLSHACPGWHLSRIRPPAKFLCPGCEVSWFCRCIRGERMESGYWFHVLYPVDEHGRRHLSTAGAEKFKAYEKGDSYHAGRIDQLVVELKRRYEHERSRKLEAAEGGL